MPASRVALTHRLGSWALGKSSQPVRCSRGISARRSAWLDLQSSAVVSLTTALALLRAKRRSGRFLQSVGLVPGVSVARGCHSVRAWEHFQASRTTCTCAKVPSPHSGEFCVFDGASKRSSPMQLLSETSSCISKFSVVIQKAKTTFSKGTGSPAARSLGKNSAGGGGHSHALLSCHLSGERLSTLAG